MQWIDSLIAVDKTSDIQARLVPRPHAASQTPEDDERFSIMGCGRSKPEDDERPARTPPGDRERFEEGLMQMGGGRPGQRPHGGPQKSMLSRLSMLSTISEGKGSCGEVTSDTPRSRDLGDRADTYASLRYSLPPESRTAPTTSRAPPRDTPPERRTWSSPRDEPPPQPRPEIKRGWSSFIGL